MQTLQNKYELFFFISSIEDHIMFIWMQYLTKNPPDKATCWLHLSLSKISLWIKEKLEDEAYVVFLCFGHLWKYHCVHKQGSSVPGPGVHSGKMYRREQSCYPWKVCKTTWSSLATMYGVFFSVLGHRIIYSLFTLVFWCWLNW